MHECTSCATQTGIIGHIKDYLYITSDFPFKPKGIKSIAKKKKKHYLGREDCAGEPSRGGKGECCVYTPTDLSFQVLSLFSARQHGISKERRRKFSGLFQCTLAPSPSLSSLPLPLPHTYINPASELTGCNVSQGSSGQA